MGTYRHCTSYYSIDEYLAEDDYVPPDDDSLILLDRCKLWLTYVSLKVVLCSNT